MKKIILIAATAALTTASVHAQSLVAAWDFNYPMSFGGFDIDGDFVNDTSAAASFGSGTFSWINQAVGGLANSANLTSNNLLRPAQIDTLPAGFGWQLGGGESSAVLTFTVDLSLFEDVELTFAYAGQNGVFDVTVAGQTFNPAADSLATVDLNAFEGGIAIVDFTFANFESPEVFLLDNVQITGTAVPEPSTYAAIFGVIALGVVAARRRK